MLYFQIHIGDWETGTRLLSLEEKGVYLDLLTLYYKQEAPIMQMQCKRIARAYTLQEQESLNYVLEQFFDFDGECYHNKRADEEIAKVHELSNARAKAAKARWNKGKNASKEESSNANAMQVQYKNDANAIQMDMQMSMQNVCKTDANQETNNQEYISSSVTDVTSEDSTPRAKMPSGGNKARTYKLDVKTLPDDWRAYCEQTRPDLDPDVVFTAFRSCFTSGSKAGTMRSEKGWNQSWFNWVRNEREPRNTYQTSRQPARKSEKEPNWAELDYGTIGAI